MAGSSWLDLNESSKFGILHGMRLVVSSTCFQKMLLPFVPAGNRLLCSCNLIDWWCDVIE